MLAETRLLHEYLAAEYFERGWFAQFSVGSDPEAVVGNILDEGERRAMRNVNRRVDAVIPPPPDLVIIEATMWRVTEKVGKLLEYLTLLPATPEYVDWQGAPLVPLILTGQHDPVAELLCRQLGLTYLFREPDWIDDFLAIYPERRRRMPYSGALTPLSALGLPIRPLGG